MKLTIKDFFSKYKKVMFTEESLNENFIFLCSDFTRNTSQNSHGNKQIQAEEFRTLSIIEFFCLNI